MLHFLRPFALKRKRHRANAINMYVGYFKYAFRHIRLNSFFSLINIIGLGMGLAACILIVGYLSNEWSYDKFHTDYERIYRIKQDIYREGISLESATTFSSVGPVLSQSYPGVETTCRLHRVPGQVTAEYQGELFLEDNLLGADSNFFELFHFPFIYGAPENALKKPNSVVVTKSIARKYFGNADPLGREIILDGAYGFWTKQGYVSRNTYVISGVIQDLPSNTHLDFDFLISLNLYSNLERELKNWGDSFYTYLKIKDPSQLPFITTGLAAIAEEYRPDQGVSLGLQAMHKIHLNSDLLYELQPNGNEKITWLLALVAAIILLIAATNYINFSTARAITRQEEAGIRKILGAHPAQLFKQFLTEAFLLNTFSLMLAFFLIWANRPFIADLLGFDLTDKIAEPGFWGLVLSILLAGTLFSGVYPALIFSKQQWRMLIIGRPTQRQFSPGASRNVLVVFQFAVSSLVIGCALILYYQMDYMQQKDLGINLVNTLVINGPGVGQDNDSLYYGGLNRFKTEVLRQTGVENVTTANFIPGKEIRGTAKGYVRKLGDPEEQATSYAFTQIDFDFISHFGIKLIAGRVFDPSFAADLTFGETIIINEEACRQLGFTSAEEAIGKKIVYRVNSTPTIVGVVNNFHQYALQRNYQPILFETSLVPKSYYYLKMSDAAKTADVRNLQALWEDTFPGNSFNYFFLDDFYAKQYTQDNRFLQTFSFFSFLAIFVAAMGFFGLMYYTAAGRIREIGIRKTFGARFWDIYWLLGKGLSLFIIGSAIISMPLMYYLSENWLQDYAFRISIRWWMLPAPLVFLLVMALLIITLQSIRSYRISPVVALREG